MVTDAKDFELLGDPSKMTGYSRPPESKLAAATRVLGVCTAVAMMMMFVIGLSVGWSSPYLAQFISGASPFPATLNEVSWMALVFQLGRIPGAILGAICVEYFGTKTVMIGNGCFLCISWILVILANSASYIFVARFIFGATAEVAVVSYPLFFGDISSSSIRGALVILAGNGVPIGILAGNAIGHYLSMRLFACVAITPMICFLLVFSWLPHSPYYLIGKGMMDDAERSILTYNPKANVQIEVESITKFLALSRSTTFIDRLREFNIPSNRKAVSVIVALYMFGAHSGTLAITNYMENIMDRAMMVVIVPAMVPVIAHSVGILAGWMPMYFAEKCGRKIMWVVSSAGTCCALISLGTHFYLIGNRFDPAVLQWLPIFSVVLMKIFVNMGLHCVPSILSSELLAANIRTLAACLIAVASSLFGFLSIYSYQFLMKHIDDAYVWWFYAAIMSVSVVFGFVLIPEMKGKTLLEIQDKLRETNNSS